MYLMKARWSITRMFADLERPRRIMTQKQREFPRLSRECTSSKCKANEETRNDAGNKGLYKHLQCERKTHNHLLL